MSKPSSEDTVMEHGIEVVRPTFRRDHFVATASVDGRAISNRVTWKQRSRAMNTSWKGLTMSKPSFEEELKRINAMLDDPIGRPVPTHHGYTFGAAIRVVEDDEDAGLFADDEGWLVLEEVGSKHYGNERVGFYIVMEGYDSPFEVDIYNVEGN